MLLKEEKTEIIEKNRTHENDEENQRSDCSSEVPQERPPLQTWSAEDGWSQKKPAELPEEEGR